MNKIPFDKHEQFVIRHQNPFNGGAPLNLLTQNHVTPTNLFFVRNHGDVPQVDIDSYRLNIQNKNKNISFTLDEIKNNFARVEVSATLQCAGNRRQELMAIKEIPHELPWNVEAISHAVWAGIKLKDVLATIGVEKEANNLHVQFQGLDETERLGKRFNFGGSIPFEKANHDEVILAYEMNGKTLSPVHGFPLRVVVPGFIGARSVKWLNQIIISDEPSQNYFQRIAYRLFASNINSDNVKWNDGLMLSEMNVTSVICSPENNQRLTSGFVTVCGYAATGGNRHIARVEISTDDGNTCMQAELDKTNPFAWTLWKVNLNLEKGKHQLIVRAVDSSANMQPKDVEQVWNFKGYMNNAWHRVNVIVE
ncbi:MAG: molybdopterin-dependent oxidoreductase [Anaerolineales bacterium]|nr:molybdopterin-dependent oxidoreductase [Anaerolineales bacterium]MBX3035972.1 molybdopterin-dependent oxidoreductase [Anaerolineales bacterium]